jgi:hypothetical protein
MELIIPLGKTQFLQNWANWRKANSIALFTVNTVHWISSFSSPLECERRWSKVIAYVVGGALDPLRPINLGDDWHERCSEIAIDGNLSDVGTRLRAISDRLQMPSPKQAVQDALIDIVIASDQAGRTARNTEDLFLSRRIQEEAVKGFNAIETAIAAAQAATVNARVIIESVSGLANIDGQTNSPASSRNDDIVLTDLDVQILHALCEARPRTMSQYDLMVEVDASRGTIGPRLDRLRSLGLVERPLGVRRGDTITAKGIEILEQFAH